MSLTSFLWDLGKQNSPRCAAEKCSVPSGASICLHGFHQNNEIQMKRKMLLMLQKFKWTHPNAKDRTVNSSQVG